MSGFVRKALVVACLSLSAGLASAAVLTPNDLGGTGYLPATVTGPIDFVMHQGDWAPEVTLPTSAPDGTRLKISNLAGSGSTLWLKKTDLPIPSVNLAKGDAAQFVFSVARGLWLFDQEATPATLGGVIHNTDKPITSYSLAPAQWAPLVTLPATAKVGRVIVVQSTSPQRSVITSKAMLYPRTYEIAAGEQYAFIMRGGSQKWMLISAPTQNFSASQIDATGRLPAPEKPRASYQWTSRFGSSQIKLPAIASDRDQIKISSLSTGALLIDSSNVNGGGTLSVGPKDEYDFTWVSEIGRWVVRSSPVRTFQLGKLEQGRMKAMTSPKAEVLADVGNWAKQLTLPAEAIAGDRVVVSSRAADSFDVLPGQAGGDFSVKKISQGDQVAFIYSANRTWQVQTRQITMLNLYSDSVAANLGEAGARARQLESLRLTNEALENSGANFRVKSVGLFRHADKGSNLRQALGRLQTDAVALNLRDSLKADATYYEGIESGCGMAWVRADAINMVAAGSLNCGTNVMRHEFGHNMGLEHRKGGEGGYGHGYKLMGTIMDGNAVPFYSTPLVFDYESGLPMGIANKTDAVRAMNERSKSISDYR